MQAAILGLFATLPIACAVLTWAVIERARLLRALRHLRERNEKLGDEIWEVRAAVEARRRAEAASEAKSRFLATVSHEVRTPLNGILGMADLLGGTALEPEQRAYVEAVRTSGRALATLIDEILDFSRIEAGKLAIAHEPFDLVAVVEGVVELLAPRAQDKGLEIAAFVAPDLYPMVMGDAVRLRQVLTNLAGNAVKFTEQGGVSLSVTPAPGGMLRFAAQDTGPGVPAAHRTSIFEDFEQVDNSSTRRHGGTGLGLAISRRIVEGMGGRLTLADNPGGGSVFAFDIRLEECGGAARPAAQPDLAGRQILIAAASQVQGRFLADYLERAGAAVMLARNVPHALAHLERGSRTDILFADCSLGQDDVARLSSGALEAGVRQRFLLFSPYERRAFGQTLVPGFDGWLVKPVRAASLAARLAAPAGSAAVEQGTAAGVPSAERAKLALPARSPRHVLLAEDNEINRLVAMSFLGRLGVLVTHAANGAEALDLALAALHGQRPAFDTILMDVSMPVLDGLEAARRLRAAETAAGASRTPIVALTAHAFADERATFLEAGMDRVLTKPIDFAELAAVLAAAPALEAIG